MMGLAALALLASMRAWREIRPQWQTWVPGCAWLWLFSYSIFMVWNAKARHSLATFKFEWLTPPFPRGPGSMALDASSGAPLEVFVLFLIFSVGYYSARLGTGWLLIAKILVMTGTAVALFGILHKVTGATAVWWAEGRIDPVTFFAPYVYHANAGAFMNLILPLAIATGLSARKQARNLGQRWVWFTAGGIIAGAILITTSKGAILLVLASLMLQALVHRRRLRAMIQRGKSTRKGRRIEQSIMIGSVAAMTAMILLIGWENSLARFETFHLRVTLGELGEEGRVKIAKVLASMISPNAGGVWGYGPGTFPHILPYFTKDLDSELTGVWHTGHNDWLQMLVEWGWIGGLAWTILGACSLFVGFLALKKRSRMRRREAPMVRGVMVGLAITGLHGSFDFPFQIFSITVIAILMAGFLWGKCGATHSKRSSRQHFRSSKSRRRSDRSGSRSPRALIENSSLS
jgi:hypothetical protein